MILLTLDTSETSEVAIPVAVDLARRFGEPLHVMLAVDGPLRHQFSESGRDREATVDEVAQEVVDAMLEQIPREGLTEVTATFRHGVDAADTIIKATEDPDVALVVMATHGRSGLSRLLTGSVAADVIRYSKVPVVVVPVREADSR